MTRPIPKSEAQVTNGVDRVIEAINQAIKKQRNTPIIVKIFGDYTQGQWLEIAESFRGAGWQIEWSHDCFGRGSTTVKVW